MEWIRRIRTFFCSVERRFGIRCEKVRIDEEENDEKGNTKNVEQSNEKNIESYFVKSEAHNGITNKEIVDETNNIRHQNDSENSFINLDNQNQETNREISDAVITVQHHRDTEQSFTNSEILDRKTNKEIENQIITVEPKNDSEITFIDLETEDGETIEEIIQETFTVRHIQKDSGECFTNSNIIEEFVDDIITVHHSQNDEEPGTHDEEFLEEIFDEVVIKTDISEITRCFRLFGKKSSSNDDEHDDYHTILKKVTKKGKLFKDKQFDASARSLKHSDEVDDKIKWLRPHEICENPEFIVDGHDRFDCKQGELGDCWLLAAVANLTLNEELFKKVVPCDQNFRENYAGIFRFSFWRFGKWVDIVVDDRLPTKNGHLIYMHSADKNEFWSALLEKAFAKLHGSYENLRGGSACEAMQDFTGGITEWYDLKDNSNMMAHFKIMQKAYDRKSMMCCSIIVDDDALLESETEDGLIRGHAYSITKVALIDIVTPNKSGQIPMIRLRNPWGNDAEWHGQWSDQSPEWQFIPENVKKEIGLNFDHDGEFWMSLQDFYHNFDLLDICHLTPDWLIEEEPDLENDETNEFIWETSMAEGKWVQKTTAGGCRNFLQTFWKNPQFKVTLVDPDDEDDDDTCSVMIALLQKNRRAQKHLGVSFLTIGFAIYELDETDLAFKKQPLEFFKFKATKCRSAFVNLREVTARFKLLPGDYLVVPSTYDPNEEAEFLLRVYTEKKNIMNKC